MQLVIDTHTADGVKVAREHLQAGVPMMVLETALPIKFAGVSLPRNVPEMCFTQRASVMSSYRFDIAAKVPT
jgi:threonine synthase